MIEAILDPESCFVIKWKRIVFGAGMLSIILDPLFLYIPNAKGPTCLDIDIQASIFCSFLRTLLDVFLLLHIILKFRIALVVPGPIVFKRRHLIKDPRQIAINYLKSWFIIDLLAVLPLPQMIIWSSSKSPVVISEFLPLVVIAQFAPRFAIMVPQDKRIMDAFGLAGRTVWSGAIYNLFVFIMMGHFFGAVYYHNYVNTFHDLVDNEIYDMHSVNLDCSQLHKKWLTQRDELQHGMLSDAFVNEIGLKSYIQKLIYCFVWGVRSVSSLGQIFDASYDVAETTFSCTVIIIGLILLADLIARMQTSVQSAGARREKQRMKQTRLEEWTHYHHLPHDLNRLVRQSVQLEWQVTNGIDDEAIFSSLPLDLQRDIRTHLYKERARIMPPFTRMDEQLLDFICGHLRPYSGAVGTYIVLQGDPLDKVVFIFSGTLQLTHHTNGHANSRNLEAGDFFGDDLLTWASQPNSFTLDLPPSYFTVKCITNVEAFCLPAQDVRLLVVFNFIHKFQLALRKHHA